MNERQTRVVSTRLEAHEAVMQAYAVARTLIQDGKRVQISVGEDCDPVTVKQRRFLHGAVLPQIAEQVRVNSVRYVADIWKEYFRNEFLGHRYEVYALPGAKRATPHRVRNSTEELSVKAYSGYIDRVIAHAATEWSVAFKFDEQERNAVRYVRPVAKRRIDAETGEILEAA